MNDDTEVAICPQCGKEIAIVLDYEPADPSVGIPRGYWFGGISVDNSECFDHMSDAQREGVVAEAVQVHEGRERDAMEREIHDEIDGLRALAEWNMGLGDGAPVDWLSSDIPF